MKNLVFGVHPVTYPARTLKSGEQSKSIPANLGEVAIWNEYGTKTSPPRPAFRMGLEEAQRKAKPNIESFLKNTAQRILQGRSDEVKKNLTNLLVVIGRSAKAATKEIIKNGSTTPNAPSTVARKGFNKPLYETGLLLDNVDYEIVD